MGITPVVWVARGHAFLGYWRGGEQGLPDAASLQIAPAANAVDLGLMGVVETTMVTRERRPPKDLFRRAGQAPKDGYFLGGSSELVGVVDVGMARLMRVLPVPARRVRADGVVELVEYTPADPLAGTTATAATRIPEPSSGPDPRPRRPDAPPRVQAWKNALLDLTLRNRLLNLAGPMTQAPLVTPSEQLGLLAQILQEGKTVSVRAVDDLAGAVAADRSRDAYSLPGDVLRGMLASRSTIYSGYASDVHKAAMTRLRYRARTAIQETGANPLYVTLGRLDWQLGDRDLSAPLLLAPVQVKGVVMPFRIAFDDSGAVTLNHSLMEKLRLEFGFTVPGLAEQLPTLPGTEHVDVGEVVRRVREAIAASGLPFRVESEARLAVIAFTGYLLWRDLDAHWERFLERPLVRHLALSPTDSFAAGEPVSLGDTDLDEVVATAPVPTDGSQAEAIAGARAGQTFVLEGPPGTGKSQTITAILADQMAQGRRVLFVAEKGAALDVVRNRLGEVGLLPFALDLHDEGARPTEVRARLRTALAAPRPAGHRRVPHGRLRRLHLGFRARGVCVAPAPAQRRRAVALHGARPAAGPRFGSSAAGPGGGGGRRCGESVGCAPAGGGRRRAGPVGAAPEWGSPAAPRWGKRRYGGSPGRGRPTWRVSGLCSTRPTTPWVGRSGWSTRCRRPRVGWSRAPTTSADLGSRRLAALGVVDRPVRSRSRPGRTAGGRPARSCGSGPARLGSPRRR